MSPAQVNPVFLCPPGGASGPQRTHVSSFRFGFIRPLSDPNQLDPNLFVLIREKATLFGSTLPCSAGLGSGQPFSVLLGSSRVSASLLRALGILNSSFRPLLAGPGGSSLGR